MASRAFTQFRYSLCKDVVDLYASITIGGTGAPTLDSGKCKGFSAISRTSAGLYSITLEDKYQRILSIGATIKVGSGSPAAPAMFLVADTVGTDKKFSIQFNDLETPAATELGSGEVVLLHVTLSNSTAL